MGDLVPGETYRYRVGSGDEMEWSAPFTFHAQRTEFPDSSPLRLLVACDIGASDVAAFSPRNRSSASFGTKIKEAGLRRRRYVEAARSHSML